MKCGREISIEYNGDECPECERLKLQHQFLKKQMQGNFSAPVHAELQKGAKVLDAACGESFGLAANKNLAAP